MTTGVVRLVVSLDGIGGNVRLDPRRLYEWRNRLWTVEPVGCVLCVEGEHPSTLASANDDGSEDFWCFRQHGDLIEVAYSMAKLFVVVIGGVSREGHEHISDSMLFPASLSEAERVILIEQLIDEASDEEHQAGVE